MNAIIGMTTIALSRISDKQKVEDCLKKTLLASRHLLGLINDILDMSKIESNKLALSYEKFDLQETVHSIYNLIDLRQKKRRQLRNHYQRRQSGMPGRRPAAR